MHGSTSLTISTCIVLHSRSYFRFRLPSARNSFPSYILLPWQNLVSYPKASHSTNTHLTLRPRGAVFHNSRPRYVAHHTPLPQSLLIMALSSPLRFFHYLITKNAWIDIAHDFDAYRFTLTIFVSLPAAICAQHFPKHHLVFWAVVTRRAGVDRARSSGRSGSEFGRTWLQRAGRCADSAFVSGLQSQ